MFSRSLLTRASPIRLSAILSTRTCSRSLSTVRLARPARCVAQVHTNLRRFSVAPASRTPDGQQTSHEPSGTCYVGNIPYNVTAEQLKGAFSEFGKVESVKLLTSGSGLPRGVGFVQFASVADAVHFVDAHEADPIFVLDRQLHVGHAQRATPVEVSDTLLVLDFPGRSADELEELFGSDADNIVAVRFDKKDAGQPSRKAFVQFRNVNAATEAIEAFKSRGENLQIRYARHRQPPTSLHSLTSRLSQHRAE